MNFKVIEFLQSNLDLSFKSWCKCGTNCFLLCPHNVI